MSTPIEEAVNQSRFAFPPEFEVVGTVTNPGLTAAAPNQARAPKGTPIGGQWIDTPGGLLDEVRGDGGGGGTTPGPVDPERAALKLSDKKVTDIRGSSVSGDRLDENGQWTPEAVADQDRIIDGLFEGVQPYGPDDEKVVYFSMGGPGSGKGSLYGKNISQSGYPTVRPIDDMTGIAEAGIPHPGAALLDSDSMKIQLQKVKELRELQRKGGILNDPTAPGGDWAGQSHEESSYMNKLAYARALKKGLPIVFDGTGDGGIDSVKEKVEQARAAGYKVKAAGVYLEPTEGLDRAIGRAGTTGRNVGKAMQAHTYADIVDTFNEAMNQKLFDSVTWLDNNGVGKAEQSPKIFEYTSGGGIRILDQAAWDKFQSSKNRLPDV